MRESIRQFPNEKTPFDWVEWLSISLWIAMMVVAMIYLAEAGLF